MTTAWKWGTVVSAPGADNYGQVSFGDAQHSAVFDPLVWGVPGGYPVPSPGDRVVAVVGWPAWVAIRPLGAGAPVGVAGGVWV